MSFLFCSIFTAFLIDYFCGEFKQHHPLVYFGQWADRWQQRFNVAGQRQLLLGFVAWAIAVMPIVLAFYVIGLWLQYSFILDFIFSSVVLYIAIGRQSLMQHAQAIIKPLQDVETLKRQGSAKVSDAENALNDARHHVSMIVSRDCSSLSEEEIIVAGTESVLENGADAIFAAIFWFCIAGVPGVVLYRLSNTLDAMWGYKNQQYKLFGRFSARFDDLLNYIPARLTALSYCLLAPLVHGNIRLAYECWQNQGGTWKSPNAGPVMSAGAGALQVSLGGTASYNGQVQYRPTLGVDIDQGRPLNAATLLAACKLVNSTVILWLLLIFIFA